MGYRVVVAGATGNVGREMINILAEREFPLDDLAVLASSRSVGDTVDYGEVVGLVTRTFSGKRFKLLEAAARALAEAILAEYPAVTKVAVTLRKPAPPIPGRMDSVGVKLDFTR